MRHSSQNEIDTPRKRGNHTAAEGKCTTPSARNRIQLAKQPADMANRIVMADVAWRDCHVVPVRLSIAQEQMVTQSQYLIEAEELQHAFLPASIEYQITASSSPGLLRVGPSPSLLFTWRECGRGRDARRWDRASAPGASPKIRSRSSTNDLMTLGSILPPSAGCIGGLMAKRGTLRLGQLRPV